MAEDTDKEDGAEGEGVEKPSSRKRLIIFAAAGLIALALAGGGAFFFLGGGDSAEEAEVERPAIFVDVREMTVNLASEPNQERPRFLRFSVALEVDDPELASALEPLMPRIEDTFQVFVRELRPSEIEGSAGIYRLREELLRRVNIAVHPAKVDGVLFKEVVVQ
ncbi:flagellar basal body-associated FliL family protein [Saliniramus sp.]|uniref:flagellar basal body-associated FliL family protein n=1 Tax=Saliniramus sp. TaxID=2986772 RepID=UPI002C099D90|nr:flagellar basal body-associated FliL family protein [Saliniramus sp.]HMB10567.1 flagellar basal body-associated FliL family protein [Saliniramus sp.]